MDFTSTLLDWYHLNKRDLPWRSTRDPYQVWVSEIILQQTRIDQGLPYYKRFIEKFPDVFSLAQASEQEVLTAWQGLGYYTRARNLHNTAKFISEQFRGQFPQTTADLLKLKGIGNYTAAAIASICFNVAEPVVDGNVIRFLSRYFGIASPVGNAMTLNEISGRAAGLIPHTQPGDFNQALMEFGATMCTPSNPSCDICPFASECIACQTGQVDRIPVRLPKPSPRSRYLYYFFTSLTIGEQPGTLLRYRTGRDIWRNLYDFPGIETEIPATDHITRNLNLFFRPTGLNVTTITDVSEEYIHLLSHQRLIVQFFRGTTDGPIPDDLRWVSLDDLHLFPLPRLIHRYLDDMGSSNKSI